MQALAPVISTAPADPAGELKWNTAWNINGNSSTPNGAQESPLEACP
jgi:hypothetical protein